MGLSGFQMAYKWSTSLSRSLILIALGVRIVVRVRGHVLGIFCDLVTVWYITETIVLETRTETSCREGEAKHN